MIEYAVETEQMGEVMNCLHRLFDIRITFFDMKEHELQHFHIKPMSPFCTAWRNDEARHVLCVACDTQHLVEAKRLRDVLIYRCHAGLIEGIVPLYDRRNIYLGAIVFGQLRERAQHADASWPDALKRKYEALPTYTVEKMRDVGLLLKCVSEFLIDHEMIRYRNKQWAEKLDTYIERHLNEKITIADLAAQIDRSPSFVVNHFAAEFGHPPRQYIVKRRMEEARVMLEHGTPVKDTAARLGFYDAFHFSRTFKRFWKVTPSAYSNGT